MRVRCCAEKAHSSELLVNQIRSVIMLRKSVSAAILLVVTFGVGFWAGRETTVTAQARNRVFELRIATLENKEKLNYLMNRFRGGELKIWDRLGMKGVGYWVPIDSPKSETTLIYVLAHESKQAADASWAKFREDPEWLAFPKTPDLGKVTLERTFMAPVDFSPMK
jgi:hypothetical protein